MCTASFSNTRTLKSKAQLRFMYYAANYGDTNIRPLKTEIDKMD